MSVWGSKRFKLQVRRSLRAPPGNASFLKLSEMFYDTVDPDPKFVLPQENLQSSLEFTGGFMGTPSQPIISVRTSSELRSAFCPNQSCSRPHRGEGPGGGDRGGQKGGYRGEDTERRTQRGHREEDTEGRTQCGGQREGPVACQTHSPGYANS